MRPARALALLLLALAAAAPTPQELHEAERARASELILERDAAARAAAAEEQERALAQARVAAAARLRQAEDALAAAAARVADLTDKRAAAAARLAATAKVLGPMLPVIERLSLYPAETLLAVPMPPAEAVRGTIVLAALSRTLERQAEALRTEQAALAALQSQLDGALPKLRDAQAAQRKLAADLDARIAATRQVRQAALDAAGEAAVRAAAEAARAEGLRAAIARIEAERQAEEARAREQAAAAERRRQAAEAAAAHTRQEALARPSGPGVGEPRGQLTAPVAGSVVRAFGAAGDAGPATGISYQTPPGARVVCPCGGRVVFAGPFRSYGLLLIVDCGGGFDFVLAGLDRLDTAVGQPVQPGEPVGVMAGWDPQKPGAARPTLYVELRKDGEPVNPAPFLRARS